MAFVVAATWKAKKGEEQRIVDVIRTMTPLSRVEVKCLYYQAQVSPEDPTEFFLYEQYADPQGYEDHEASPSRCTSRLGYAIDYLEARELATYETIDV